MVFCHKCGTDLPVGAKYCFKCGANQGPPSPNEFSVASEDLVKTVKDLMHEGNVRRIIVKDEHGNTMLELPVTAGVVGVVLAPWLAAVGAIAALVSHCTISVERKEQPDHQPTSPAPTGNV